jgi:IS1 family transposase
VLHCADSGKSHTQNILAGTHGRSHALPKPTHSVLSASRAVHSCTDTPSPTQILLPTAEQEIFPRPVSQTHTAVTNAHNSTVRHHFRSLKYVALVRLPVHNFACPPCCYNNPKQTRTVGTSSDDIDIEIGPDKCVKSVLK